MKFEKLQSLVELDLSHCSELRCLPDSIVDLPQLKKFRLRGCSKLENLPANFEKLQSLVELDLSHCSKLPCLPPHSNPTQHRSSRWRRMFQLFFTSFNIVSNVLNFLGVVVRVSHHSLPDIFSTLSSSIAFEPSWMSPSFSRAQFYKACVRDIHIKVMSFLWIIATLA